MVYKRREAIAHLFNTGIGLKAQFIDSQIAEEVLLAMMYQDIPVLPIHDSFIVRTGYAFLLHEEYLSYYFPMYHLDSKLLALSQFYSQYFQVFLKIY